MVLWLICVISKSLTWSTNMREQILHLLKQTFQSYQLDQCVGIASKYFLLPPCHVMSTPEFIAVLWLLWFRSWCRSIHNSVIRTAEREERKTKTIECQLKSSFVPIAFHWNSTKSGEILNLGLVLLTHTLRNNGRFKKSHHHYHLQAASWPVEFKRWRKRGESKDRIQWNNMKCERPGKYSKGPCNWWRKKIELQQLHLQLQGRCQMLLAAWWGWPPGINLQFVETQESEII